MKGNRKHEQYMKTLFPQVEIVERDRPGRSEDKIDDRNEFIMYRKYWLQKTFKNITWAVVKRHLAEELFLEEKTIENIVMGSDGDEIFRQIINEAPTVKDLQKKYWRVRWDLTIVEVLK